MCHKEGRSPKNWCLRTVVLEKTPESPLDSKEIKPVNLKGGQPWIFTGRTGAEAESPGFWSSNPNRPKIYWIFEIIEKVPDAGKDWRQEEKGMTKDEIVGWHHWCNGHEFEQTPGDGEVQGSLAFCSPWGHRESDMAEWLSTAQHMAALGIFSLGHEGGSDVCLGS